VRRIAQLALAAGTIAASLVALRKLLDDRAERLRSAAERTEADGISNGTAELTREELYEKAQQLEIEGRSKMNKRELERAVAKHEAAG
jgi:hypothetical protein